MPQVDPELFDRGQFQAELALKASPIAAFKKAIRHAREVLDGRFKSGRDVRRLVEDRAWFVDQILRDAWERLDWDEHGEIALLAVGGYGRGELFPSSDVDVLVLLPDGASPETDATLKERLEGFIGACWDLGLEIGSSVRTVDDCVAEAGKDVTVQTSLLEARPLAANELERRELDLLVGWRKNRQDGLFLRKIPSWCANYLIGRITGVKLHDYGCSLKIYRASVIKQVKLMGEMHRFIPAWMATVTSPARMAEEPVSHHASVFSPSTTQPSAILPAAMRSMRRRVKARPLSCTWPAASVQ